MFRSYNLSIVQVFLESGKSRKHTADERVYSNFLQNFGWIIANAWVVPVLSKWAQYASQVRKNCFSFFHDSTSVRVQEKAPVEAMKMRLVGEKGPSFLSKLAFLRFYSD